ncbi:interferon-induced protein 44-like [Betta splendens]|uniref:Interferon-induced protein 44-like n=1 Tax=Betta splendens TaxID=158456 RepID=A0A9W2XFR9_BETSP|nr:interferon-induced protein 44-like [Betta splendens]
MQLLNHLEFCNKQCPKLRIRQLDFQSTSQHSEEFMWNTAEKILYLTAMGGQSSQPITASSTCKLLYEPWRQIDWGKKQESLQYVNDYKPFDENQKLRILLCGQCGAGKSSFINSVQSVLRGRMYRQALAANTSGDSFTKKNTTYKIQRERPDKFYPFVFNDIMGLSGIKGVLVDDIKQSLQGHVKDNYKFNTDSKLEEGSEHFNKAPTNNDVVQVLVCVAAADTLSVMSDDVLRKFKEIRKETSQLDVPQIAILTKVDAACPEVKKDLKNVYRCKRLKEMMESFSANTEIPMNSIFLIKNYHEEINLNDDIDSLILNVLTHILNTGEDFVNRKL